MSAPSKGKEREWDGRGSGVHGWETHDEEDMWKAKLDFGGAPSDYLNLYLEEDEDEDVLSVGELMELRYIKAEREKELVGREDYATTYATDWTVFRVIPLLNEPITRWRSSTMKTPIGLSPNYRIIN